MIDILRIRNNAEQVKENLRRRGGTTDMIDDVRALDETYRARLEQLNTLQAERNLKSTKQPTPEEREHLKALAQNIKKIEKDVKRIEDKMEARLRQVPNLLLDDVPDGAGDAQNEIVRTVGDIPSFAFEIEDHLTIGERLDIIDVNAAAKVSGSRFTYLKGDAVLLQMALLHYALNVLVSEGFVPTLTPHLISREAMAAMGYLDKGGEEEIYHLKHDDLVLIGTSEQSIGPMYMNTTLDVEQLPLRFVGISPCYRREAGSYGKDVRGILRLHQFDKIEMFSFTSPDQSETEHLFLLNMQERLMQGLGLPYRVIKLCAGDTGFASARTFDIETWLPAQNQYRETHSTSTTTDFQTRRLKTRIKGGKGTYAHALNGTAFAFGRILIALLENGQEADGRVRIPNVLQTFMGGRTHISRQHP
ncbi:MAG: serine--tRNA ligase [Patescibacteria group bacterium]